MMTTYYPLSKACRVEASIRLLESTPSGKLPSVHELSDALMVATISKTQG